MINVLIAVISLLTFRTGITNPLEHIVYNHIKREHRLMCIKNNFLDLFFKKQLKHLLKFRIRNQKFCECMTQNLLSIEQYLLN